MLGDERASYGSGAQTVRCAAGPVSSAEDVKCSPGRGRVVAERATRRVLGAGRRAQDRLRCRFQDAQLRDPSEALLLAISARACAVGVQQGVPG